MFGYNESLGETVLTDPSLVLYFARDRHFTKLKSIEDLMQDYARFSVTSPDLWLSSQLARFKRRNILRIVLKDVLGLPDPGGEYAGDIDPGRRYPETGALLL